MNDTNYINVLHGFSKNLRGALFKFMSKIIFFYQKYTRVGGFLKSQTSPHTPPSAPVASNEGISKVETFEA